MRRRSVRRWMLWITLLSALGVGASLRSQDPAEQTRALCDPAEPVNKCPGRECICVEDTLELTFDGQHFDSVLQYGVFEEGMVIRMTVVTETRSERISGWSYGVAHDASALALLDAGLSGTDAHQGILCEGFDATGMEGIETCGPDSDCAAANRTPGGGWISAAVIMENECELPLRRNTLAWAEYRLLRDVGDLGTVVRFTDRLAKTRSPPAIFNVTVNGQHRVWSVATEGWIVKAGAGGVRFLRGDVGVVSAGEPLPADGAANIVDAVRILMSLFGGVEMSLECELAADADDSGAVNATDAVYLLNYIFRRGPEPPAPFGARGQDFTPEGLGCRRYP